MASIGGITVQFLMALELSDSRRNQTVDIPYGYQTGYSLGGQMTSYRLQSEFYGATVAEAKAVRAALRSLVKQFNQEVVRIDFDHDQAELSGWFLIESLDTSIEGSRPGTYPFTMSARRLAGLSGSADGLAPAIYWRSYPITSDCWTAQEWISLPSADLADETRETADGDVGLDLSPASNPVILADDATTYASNCRIYDSGTVFSNLSNIALPASNWTTIQSPGEATGTVIFDNGLVRMSWQSAGVGGFYAPRNYLAGVYAPSTNSFHAIGSGFNMHGFFSTATELPQTYNVPPALLEFSNEKIVWAHRFLNRYTQEYAYNITFTMMRGQPWIGFKVEAVNDLFSGKSFMRYPISGSASTSFKAPSTPICWTGDIRNESGGPTILSGTMKANAESSAYDLGGSSQYNLNVRVADGSSAEFALLLKETSLSTGASVAAVQSEITPYAKQYIAGMSQQTVLIRQQDVFA